MNNAIFFDLDGTLIDTKLDLNRAVVYAAQSLNVSVLTRKQILALVGNGIHKLIEKYLEMVGSGQYFGEFLEIFLDYYYEHISDQSIAYPNVRETLIRLKTNHKLFVVSNKLEKFSKKLLENLNLIDLFEEIVGGDTFQNKKPHPQPILELSKKYNISSSHSLFIGDSENDYYAAKSANIRIGWVSFGYRDDFILKTITPDFIIDDFKYILSVAL